MTSPVSVWPVRSMSCSVTTTSGLVAVMLAGTGMRDPVTITEGRGSAGAGGEYAVGRGSVSEDADAALCQELELKSRALQQASERFCGAQPRRDGLRSLVPHDSGDIHEMQAGLLSKRFQRLRERLRGNGGGQRRGFIWPGQARREHLRAQAARRRRARGALPTAGSRSFPMGNAGEPPRLVVFRCFARFSVESSVKEAAWVLCVAAMPISLTRESVWQSHRRVRHRGSAERQGTLGYRRWKRSR